MKVRIFRNISQKNNKPYWSITGKNYKDSNDKINYYFNFTKDSGEPMPTSMTAQNGNQYQYAEIDILEGQFGCYKGQPQITIFKYVQNPLNNDKMEHLPINNNNMMGGKAIQVGEEVIDTDALPFY